jgi:hypothetical protein
MNRRNFFKTIGIPTLALPFVKQLKLKRPCETYRITKEANKRLKNACDDFEWITHSHWECPDKISCITTVCPHCWSYKLKIPIVWHPIKFSWQKRRWLIGHVCKSCHKPYLIDIRISDIKNYFLVRYHLN